MEKSFKKNQKAEYNFLELSAILTKLGVKAIPKQILNLVLKLVKNLNGKI